MPFPHTKKRPRTVFLAEINLERVTGIEPASSAWKAEVLPMNYTRKMVGMTGFEPATSCSQSRRATKLRHIPTLHSGIDYSRRIEICRKTLRAISPCPSPLHPPYEHRPLTKFARPLPLSTRFTKTITTIRIYAPHFFYVKYHMTGYTEHTVSNCAQQFHRNEIANTL